MRVWLRRLWLHSRARLAEEKARTALLLRDETGAAFFSERFDNFVNNLKAMQPSEDHDRERSR